MEFLQVMRYAAICRITHHEKGQNKIGGYVDMQLRENRIYQIARQYHDQRRPRDLQRFSHLFHAFVPGVFSFVLAVLAVLFVLDLYSAKNGEKSKILAPPPLSGVPTETNVAGDAKVLYVATIHAADLTLSDIRASSIQPSRYDVPP
jgi:hypothetical protein